MYAACSHSLAGHLRAITPLPHTRPCPAAQPQTTALHALVVAAPAPVQPLPPPPARCMPHSEAMCHLEVLFLGASLEATRLGDDRQLLR